MCVQVCKTSKRKSIECTSVVSRNNYENDIEMVKFRENSSIFTRAVESLDFLWLWPPTQRKIIEFLMAPAPAPALARTVKNVVSCGFGCG